MSHNIYKDSFFSVKEKAWHGLGKIVESCPTSTEAIILAGMDYEVVKGQAFVKYAPEHFRADTKGSIIDNTYFTYRTDTLKPLCRDGNAITEQYQVIQNKEAFTFFDSIVGEGKAIYETAGVLGIGEQIFITAKLSTMFNIGIEDDVESYLLLTMRHDGLGSLISMVTPVRVVCNNTLSAALEGNQHKLVFRHTKSIKDNIAKAAQLYKFTLDTMNNIVELYKHFTKVKISDEQKIQYINTVFLSKEELHELALAKTIYVDKVSDEIISTRKVNIIKDVLKYTEVGVGQQLDTAKGTVWGAYNGVTGYFQNVKEFTTDNKIDNEKKFKSNLLGNNYNVMQKAIVNAYELATKTI